MSETRERKSKIWARAEDDWYQEQPVASERFFWAERFYNPDLPKGGTVWDPCSGQGNIVRSALARGLSAVGSDIVDRHLGKRPNWYHHNVDFLKWRGKPLGHSIVMNPPFKDGMLEAFTRKALQVAIYKVAVFAEARFAFGEDRALGLFRDHPPHVIYAVTPRTSAPPGAHILAGGKVGGGQADHVWLCWDNSQPFDGDTRWRWLTKTPRELSEGA